MGIGRELTVWRLRQVNLNDRMSYPFAFESLLFREKLLEVIIGLSKRYGVQGEEVCDALE